MTPAPTKYPVHETSRAEFIRLRLRVLESWKGTIDIELYLEIQRLKSELKTLDTTPQA